MTNIDVRLIRQRMRISQEELGRMIGVSRNTIANYEKGGVIPESKRDLLLKLMNRDVAVEKILGVIKASGDNNISNTGSIDGGVYINTEVKELKKRIDELEKENKELRTQLHEMSLMNGKLALEISRNARKKN